MILIFSDDKAGVVLEEIGQLQRQVEAGSFHSATGQDICERADAVAEYFVARGNNNVYEPLIKPLMEWAIYALAPKFLMDAGPDGAANRAIYSAIVELHGRYEHLKR
ncbi:hypothetical protein ACFVWT_18525 [Arthrobacter sp. NPDC058288]|uniref:hypothetical protein n=1 Tax=Arthrobacter sp. NPDC058288 TaxID=3346424 RepID=UPI0036E5BEE6